MDQYVISCGKGAYVQYWDHAGIAGLFCTGTTGIGQYPRSSSSGASVLNFTTFLRQDSEAVIDVYVPVLVAVILDVTEKSLGPDWCRFRVRLLVSKPDPESPCRDIGEGLLEFRGEESRKWALVCVREISGHIVIRLASQPVVEGLFVEFEKFFHG